MLARYWGLASWELLWAAEIIQKEIDRFIKITEEDIRAIVKEFIIKK